MPIVGIDLGTTNSLVALIEGGRPKLITGEDGSPLVPSIVAFKEDGSVSVGADARRARADGEGRVVYSAKRFIGRGLKDVAEWTKLLPFDFSASDAQMVRFQVGGKAVSPIEVSALVLKKLKSLAEAQLSSKVTQAVITVPAYFNDSQRQATKFAGEVAGLEVLRIVNEPTAACLAYGLDKKTMGTIAVFDLGGGTFDISCLRVKDGVFEVLATNGDTALGGDDFDHAIAGALAPEIRAELGRDPLATPESRTRLILEAERLKRALSDAEEADFTFGDEQKTFSRRISRAAMESWLTPILAAAAAPCRQCLTDAGLDAKDITDVILVGGSTRVPLVRRFVQEIFRRPPICTINPDEVVAMGAAVQAHILAGQQGGMLLLDVIPLSLGIETMGGVVSRIIHRNSTIPISASEHFSTYVDGQTAVDIHVVQGERELVKDNRSLARFQLRDLPPLPAGVPKLEVEFIVDANGILNVRAIELRTGKTASTVVNPSYGLNDSEVERMLSEAFDNAEADFEARFLVEARTEGDSLVRATRKSLQKGRSLIATAEAAEIETAASRLEQSLSCSDRKLIKDCIEHLNQVTQHLAETLLNHAVGEALRDKELP